MRVYVPCLFGAPNWPGMVVIGGSLRRPPRCAGGGVLMSWLRPCWVSDIYKMKATKRYSSELNDEMDEMQKQIYHTVDG